MPIDFAISFFSKIIIDTMKILLTVIFLTFTYTSLADWQPLPSTKHGFQLRYNSETGQIQTLDNGRARLMWDGIHLLQNGDVIRIKNGIAVADLGLKNALAAARAPEKPSENFTACHVLVRKVCGLKDSCGAANTCARSRQLMDFYDSAPIDRGWQYVEQCEEALTDDIFFKPCPLPLAGVLISACDDLVKKTCGLKGRCQDSQACNIARQLQKMEYMERIAQPQLETPSDSTRQCNDNYPNDIVFKSCW